MLREECRIVGKLVGCLPRAPRQNIQLGLPLQLMPEEAKLLVDIGMDKSVNIYKFSVVFFFNSHFLVPSTKGTHPKGCFCCNCCTPVTCLDHSKQLHHIISILLQTIAAC